MKVSDVLLACDQIVRTHMDAIRREAAVRGDPDHSLREEVAELECVVRSIADAMEVCIAADRWRARVRDARRVLRECSGRLYPPADALSVVRAVELLDEKEAHG